MHFDATSEQPAACSRSVGRPCRAWPRLLQGTTPLGLPWAISIDVGGIINLWAPAAGPSATSHNIASIPTRGLVPWVAGVLGVSAALVPLDLVSFLTAPGEPCAYYPSTRSKNVPGRVECTLLLAADCTRSMPQAPTGVLASSMENIVVCDEPYVAEVHGEAHYACTSKSSAHTVLWSALTATDRLCCVPTWQGFSPQHRCELLAAQSLRAQVLAAHVRVLERAHASTRENPTPFRHREPERSRSRDRSLTLCPGTEGAVTSTSMRASRGSHAARPGTCRTRA